MTKKLSDCFEEAAVLIEERGWGQNGFWDSREVNWDVVTPKDRQNFCIIGACRTACPLTYDADFAEGLGFTVDRWEWDPVTRTDVETIRLSPKGGKPAFKWNDAANRTKEEVIERLRTDAARLRAEGK